MKRYCAAVVLAGSMVCHGAAQAQDSTLPALSGTVSLSSGFTPDPYRVELTSGGPNSVSRLGGGCVGYVSESPDFELRYSAGSLPLIFRTIAGSDTTLVINGPDGRWYCNDDGYAEGDAEVSFASPVSGTYDVWVGSYSEGGGAAASLLITELADSAPVASAPTEQPDPSETARYGEIVLRSGFRPDPRRVAIRAGGTIAASGLSSGCQGSIARAPDYQVTYTAGAQPLIFRTQSAQDTTLVISGPRGEWICDDDSAGSSNAEVLLEKPESGVYDVWVGTYGGGVTAATLTVTERRR